MGAGGWTHHLQSIFSRVFPRWISDPCETAWRTSPWPYPMLTFDDVDEGCIRRILAILEPAGIQAVFFVVGRDVERRPDLLSAITAAGHIIGNHSYSHRDMRALKLEDAQKEIAKTQEIISEYGGPRWFRPPYGAISKELREWLHQEGYTIVLWSLDVGDWRKRATVESVVAAAGQATDRDIVLMHARPVAVDALPKILERWNERNLLPSVAVTAEGNRA